MSRKAIGNAFKKEKISITIDRNLVKKINKTRKIEGKTLSGIIEGTLKIHFQNDLEYIKEMIGEAFKDLAFWQYQEKLAIQKKEDKTEANLLFWGNGD